MIIINDDIKNKLLPYQIEHTENLIYSIKTYQRVLDASDTGTGKTYSAVAACLSLGLKPLIICPKSVLTSWRDVLKYFNSEFYGITNYESIQNCKYFVHNENIKVICPYIKRTIKEKEIKKKKKIKKKLINVINDLKNQEEIKYVYHWNCPNDMILIFDEAHKCKNIRTTNAGILKQAGLDKNTKIMLISATVSDKHENFHIAGYILKLYKSLKEAGPWIEKVGKDYDNPAYGIFLELYPELASRMRIRDLGNLFPDNQIIATCYNMDCQEELQEKYKLIEEAVTSLKKKEDNSGCALSKILYARMGIEELKIPTLIELTKKYIDEGLSVAIFVSFTHALKCLAEELKTNCLVFGEQTLQERNKNIEDFNNDKARIIICNIRSGGCGISLHDQNGVYPRISLISPSFSAQDIIQSLGRIYRSNTKTKVQQRLIYCKGTIEEQICENIKEKIKNIGNLNDGDILSYQIEGLMDDQTVNDNDGLSETEILMKKISSLNIKKERLKQDLLETDDELKTFEILLQSIIN